MTGEPIDIGGQWGTRTGLFVSNYGAKVSVSVRHPAEPYHIKSVDLPIDAFDKPDIHSIDPALAVLNKAIAGWPVGRITAGQVRAAFV